MEKKKVTNNQTKTSDKINPLVLKCPVCLKTFGKNLIPYVMSCGHNICIEDSNNMKTCPLCRETLTVFRKA